MRETRTVEKIFQYWHRQRSTFSCAFWFFSCVRTEQTPLEKERKKKQQEREREREREKKREKERRERERPSTKNTTTTAPLFAEKKKHRTENFVSQHIMASPEAAAILRELQGKNGNGVRF
jgi:FtsZ-interacting cell division protein YlmF